LYDEIDFLVRESKGAYTFNDAYEMPTYLRKYYIMKISDENQKLMEEMEKKNNIMSSTVSPTKKSPSKKKAKTDAYLTKAGKK
jgi:hypothetical protein